MHSITIARLDRSMNVRASLMLGRVSGDDTGSVNIFIDGAQATLTVEDARRLAQALDHILAIPTGAPDVDEL